MLNERQYHTSLASPLGLIEIIGTKKGVEAINFVEKTLTDQDIPDCILEAKQQLKDYFEGRRKEFNFKINLKGTEFQKKVWKELLNIPFGKTMSYLELARKVGDAKAARAVGGANGKNKIGIVIPCHRVIGSDGKLIGYAGGKERKKWLVTFEQGQEQKTLFE